MSKSNEDKKTKQLGMPYGTANNILKKNLLFYFVQKENLDICYRCNEKIENVESLSIEHKKSWLDSDNPKETFFDLNNIAFSHLNCNSKAGKKVGNRNQPLGKSGYRGAYYRNDKNLKKPYQARIYERGKHLNLGFYETAKEASNAYHKYLNKTGPSNSG